MVVCTGDVRIVRVKKSRSPAHVTYTDLENPNMMHTREDAIRSGRGSDQYPVKTLLHLQYLIIKNFTPTQIGHGECVVYEQLSTKNCVFYKL